MSFEAASLKKAHVTRNIYRGIWRKIHLYPALFFGFMFAFSGLTGSALVFYQEIDEYLNPALLTVEPDGEYVPLTEITAAAQGVAPLEAKPARLYFPQHPRKPIKIRFSLPKGGKSILLDVTLNPFTAEVLGQREWGNYLMSFLYKMHYTLLLGDSGKTIMGVMGLLLLCSIASGIVLWRPKRSKFFQAFIFKRSANRTRFVYDLHKTIGAYAAIALIVVGFSGIYLIFPQYVKSIVGMVLSVTEPAPSEVSVGNKRENQKVDIDKVREIASDLFPKAELQRIYFPVSIDSPYRVIMRQPGEIRKTGGSTQLWLSSYNGEILTIQEPQTMHSGDTFLSWMFPLHNGQAFGLLGRIFVFLIGFIPIILYVTGLIVWRRKRKARI